MKLHQIFENQPSGHSGSIPIYNVDRFPGPDPSMHKMGSGVQSTAYQKGSSVVKYTTIASHADDEPAVHFINMCMYHHDNPYLPKYHSAEIFKVNDSMLLVSSGELLHTTLQDAVSPELMESVVSIKMSQAGEHRIGKMIEHMMWSDHGDDDDAQPTKQQMLSYRFNAMYDILTEIYEPLRKVARLFDDKHMIQAWELISYIDEHKKGHSVDLHDENWMFRGTQLVMLDPVVGRETVMNDPGA